ncbi:MAG TPA: DUF3047 domain-containing protein [Oligoflexia bacterium]|nr:DUF3047 domain-containing protein [Oligoflexia bacterium]HMR24444.1 DUF3047 domain-containing protein [Oligoflexia bacterium]
MMFKKKYILHSLIFMFFGTGVFAQEKLVLEDFEKQGVGAVDFNGWHVSDIKGEAKDIYSIVKEDNNLFLHADSKKTAAAIFKIKGWSLKYRPVLSWRWRVHKHPKGAKPLSKPNNSAASVYVIFRKSLIPLRFETIKYVWAENEPVDGHVYKDGKNPQELIVIRSGKEGMGEWITEERDVLADYQKYFKTDKVRSPMAFGILTDSERIKKGHAIADYDDFVLLKEKSQPKKPTPKAEEKVVPTPDPVVTD